MTVPGARWRLASRRSTSFAIRNETRIAAAAIPIRTASSRVIAALAWSGALLASQGVSMQSTTAPAPNLRGPSLRSTQKLAAFGALVATISALNYLGTYAVHASKAQTENTLYHYSTAVARGDRLRADAAVRALDRRLEARAARSAAARATGSRALGCAGLVFVGILLVNLAIDPFLHAGREQGTSRPTGCPPTPAPTRPTGSSSQASRRSSRRSPTAGSASR